MFSKSLIATTARIQRRFPSQVPLRLLSNDGKNSGENDHPERHQNIDQGFNSYPWESNDILDTDTTAFPWEATVKGNKLSGGTAVTETAVDPTRAELILGPIKKKSANRNIKTSSSGITNNFKELLDFKHEISDSDMISSIESLKPSEQSISLDHLQEITISLDRMCRRNHLVNYLKESGPDVISKIGSKALTKKLLIKSIITELWDLKIHQSNLDTSAEVTYTIDLTHKRDLFLLSSSRGVLFDHWSLMGAKLSVNTSTRELIVKGSQNIVDFVQTSWNQMLNGVVCRKFKLAPLLELFKTFNGSEEQWSELISEIQQNTGAYFELIDKESDTYLVSAINKHVLRSVKTEFIKLMNFQDQSNITVIDGLDMEESFKIDTPDKLLPWYVQSQKLSQPFKSKKRRSHFKLTDESTGTEELSKEIQQLRLDVNQATELFEYNFINSEDDTMKNKETADTIDSFFNLPDDKNADEPIDSAMESIDPSYIEKKLEHSSPLEFTEQNLIDLEPLTSAKFGHLLTSDSSKLTYFNSQLSDITRKISNLPLLNKSLTVIGDAGRIKTNFSNHLSIKLSSDLLSVNAINLPHLELVINLKGGIVELQSFDQSRLWDLFMTESENIVRLQSSFEPDIDYDVSLINSKNSLLVYNLQDCINNGKDDKLLRKIMEDETLNMSLFNRSSVNKSLNLINRKSWDIRKYQDFENLIKGISSKTFNLALPLKTDGEKTMHTHKYHVVDVELIKTLELEFLNSPLIYEVRDNTQDTKVNISLIKENESLEDFIKKSLQLAKYLTN